MTDHVVLADNGEQITSPDSSGMFSISCEKQNYFTRWWFHKMWIVQKMYDC